MSASLNWGIIGTGNIAKSFARNLPQSRTGKLVAAASRSQAGADAFAKEFPAARPFASYQAMLADPEVQAVYISTPHPMHLDWIVACARAGKHILCEKPIAMNHSEAMIGAEAARQHGVFLMEAFMYRCLPQTARIVEIIRSGQLGELRLIDAVFAFDVGSFKPESRLFDPALGGGAILDVGCYCMSMTRLIAGAAMNLPFAEPVHLKAIARLGESGVDEQAQALLTFENGLQARLITAVRLGLTSSVVVHGTNASLRVLSPWFGGTPAAKLELVIKGNVEEIVVDSPGSLYSYEIDSVADHLAQKESPCMPVEDSLGNMAGLDRWRKEIGLAYPVEKEPVRYQVRQASATVAPNVCAAVPGLPGSTPTSRLVLGTVLEGAISVVPHAYALFDYFVEQGGTLFDTAYVYGSGLGERMLGQWMRLRGARDQVRVIVKGAHTPLCDPESLRKQFHESLDRLQTGYADIYMLHRDNLDVPVGEFVDVLNEQVDAGRLGIFGGSNWTLARVDEANAYAAKKGVQGFGAVSNQFSLARMIHPIWDGCLSNSDAESRAWHVRTGIPLFAWSSQARGFFVRGNPDFHGDAELERTWYSPDNFQRLDRVRELAREKKTEPVLIAAAYVMQQPFPLFALIGPRKLSELAGSFDAFKIELSPCEMAWLNLESDTREG